MTKGAHCWPVLSLFVLCGCANQPVVGYQRDIEPILHKRCQQCHTPPDGKGYVRTGLNMETYDTLMNGTMFGTVIIPGDSKRSVLNKLVEGRAGELMRMPHGDERKLTRKEVDYIKLWVDQGALDN